MNDEKESITARWAAYSACPTGDIRSGGSLACAALAYGGPNIGDDIQTIAAERFLPEVSYYVYREDVLGAKGMPEAFFIANGWYAHRPNRFIPPKNLHPFYVSIHLSYPRRTLTRAVVRFLRRHEPIGCRDFPTLSHLQSRGIDSYFSGCLTLTLLHPGGQRDGPVVISDLDSRLADMVPRALARDALALTHNTDLGIVSGLRSSFQPGARQRIAERLDILAQDSVPGMEKYPQPFSRALRVAGGLRPEEHVVRQRHDAARAMLNHFATARLVITSRLHCALPCLAFGTPVVMIHHNPNDPRFLGVDKYLRIYGPGTPGRQIDWNPEPSDVSALSDPLAELTAEAVRIQRNPLSGLRRKA